MKKSKKESTKNPMDNIDIAGKEIFIGDYEMRFSTKKMNKTTESYKINSAIVTNKSNANKSQQSIVLQTEGGYFLRFHGEEVSEMKKTAVGVKGIKLQKNDLVENVYLFEEGKETKVMYKEKEITLNRLKGASRGGSGNKQRV